jgi:tRNA U38,U39,U40 pseudouridine synthase TruA
MVPFQTAEAEGPIPGKYLPHPINATDHSSFLPIPSDGRLGLILFKLNRIFPPDVRVSAISPMPATITTTRPSSVVSKDSKQPFHPSLDSMGKQYRYTFSTGDMHDPLRWRHVWHLEDGSVFNLDRARQAIPILLGCNNLGAFESMARGKRREDTICTIEDIIIVKEGIGDCDGPSGAFDQMHSLAPEFTIGMRPLQDVASSKPLETFSIEITGDRFLYKMARNLVGAIVAIGKGQVELTDVQKALQNGEWDSSIKKRPVCAPAHGLILQHVVYPNNMSFDWVNQPEAK